MSDKKNNHNADLEANLAKIANTKPQRRNRKDNIYERFITRVESADIIDSADDDDSLKGSIADKPAKPSALKPLKNANKLSSYEPLSAAELELFAIQDQDSSQNKANLQTSDFTSTAVSLDLSEAEDEVATNHVIKTDSDNTLIQKTVYIADSADSEHLTTESAIKEPVNKKTVKPKDKLASSKKPLLIGMIFGSLLIAAIVFTLIFTGVLSTATAPAGSDSATPALSENTTPVTSTQQGAAIDGDKPSDSTVANTSNTSTSEPQTAVVNDANKNAANTVDDTNKPAVEATVSDVNTEPTITYDDFREESQNTLYRETND
ncbi:hypothetical protein [Psychrobacter sp. DAB_AL62B]|uniref:hypothetical protein n=1 Tax=Psychrobacter sp. DAB_AL62B TaxID=1028420 RepID=UPI0023818100|nr:hypothetical protein [Psychrobacter sp. DAB_AL62B]MDE4454005.1 hypothetical protein [Psychrobacter sp. DAB_AL62B]